ncbi:MAG: Asp-tRNA(Asn)/Glu-tRNA(Gln) amidotransferase subunit GatC [Chloroflexi bacterium]|nr:Asp-tRNA(Asn)/Glu-tRNA(Gln) amidotransferase subunit GatC [Chloroflexota bacterium]MDA1240179.1 Asp-tRNA(Asn)/Glu-tRNA(Gln) amidotransferase subunit GatC [Chloroflexota bacterium]MQC48282.1 Asp-tRNA(Asn)/Glu-tRNA(Gln) amidotransferase subunit GatC [Chloroflexota bacterium]
MALTADEIRHIATLARLALSDDEVSRLGAQLSAILDHFEVLNEIDTEGVPPTAQSFDLHNVERDDVVTPSLSVEDVALNAPRMEDRYLRVRTVLE